MREILFRGKTSNNIWIYGNLNYYPDINRTFIRKNDKKLCPSMQSSLEEEVSKKTVGQYTGLADKNGTKIFEGDIVDLKTTTYHFKNCRIKYQVCYARYCAIDNHGYEYPMDNTFEYEVVGNVWDNPELMEGAKQWNAAQ